MDVGIFVKLMAQGAMVQLHKQFKDALMVEAERCVDEVIAGVTKDLKASVRYSTDPLLLGAEVKVNFERSAADKPNRAAQPPN